MKKNFSKLVAALSGILVAGQAFAIGTVPYSGQTIKSIVLNVTKIVLGFAGALATLFIIYAGILYITSSGDKDRIESAKKTLTYAVIGVIVVALSYFIVGFIDSNLGTIVGS